MRRHFETLEDEIKNCLLRMGGLAEEMIHLAAEALVRRQEEFIKKVQNNEKLVNQLHVEIDDRCFKLLARYTPAAEDLRFVMAAIKINSDLERIADQAVNISQSTAILLQQPPLEKKLLDIPRMAEVAKGMLKDSLDALVRRDVAMARSIMQRDSEEDQLKRKAFQELMGIMQSDGALVQRALGLLLISRNLERIADHATNIAEDVIFMVLGKDIRHGASTQTDDETPET